VTRPISTSLHCLSRDRKTIIEGVAKAARTIFLSFSTSFKMTAQLPPNLLALFAPRPPLRWVPPSDHAPEERKTAQISGIAAFLPHIEEYKQTDKYEPTESHLQKTDRLKTEKKQRQQALLKETPLLCEGPICPDHLLFSPDRVLDVHVTTCYIC
jgi:hypothetical protein